MSRESIGSLIRTGLLTLIFSMMILGAYMCKTNSKYLNFLTGNEIISTDTIYLPGETVTIYEVDTAIEWRTHHRPTKIRWRTKVDTHYIDISQENSSGAIMVDDTLRYARITTHEFANAVFEVIDSLTIINDSIHHTQRVEFTDYIEKELVHHYDTVRITNTVPDRKLRLWVGAGSDYNFMLNQDENLPTHVPIYFSIQNQNFELGLSKDILTPQGHIYIKMPIRKFFKRSNK